MHLLRFGAKQLCVSVSIAISLFIWNKGVINTLGKESAERDAERHEKLPILVFGEECAALPVTLISSKAAESL